MRIFDDKYMHAVVGMRYLIRLSQHGIVHWVDFSSR